MSETVAISNGDLAAEIALLGAELVSLKDSEGREYMSDGDPAFWTGRAPVLFPIVGGLNGGIYRYESREYELARHGFARKSVFELVERGEGSARFRLTDNADTQASYPFAFVLDMAFELDGKNLSICATVRNTGDAPMPFSFGYHPAFAWPLPDGGDKLAHRILFAEDEPAPIRRLDADGLVASSEQSPVAGGALALAPDLFEADAMIWDQLASRRVTYASSDGPSLDIGFDNLPYLGIWQKPGANFVCIEPWAGLADGAGFAGEFEEKRGIMTLAPGDERSFPMDVAVNPG